MKRLFLFAAVAGLGLVSASPPAKHPAREAPGGYPPCSRTVTDHCIQLYERGVRTPENLADNASAEPKPEDAVRVAQARHDDGCDCRPEHRRLAQRIRRAGERG